MKHEAQNKADEYTKVHRRQKNWKRAVTCFAAVVVFCTVYALILPAITMEKEPCKIPEHTHSEACYTQDAAEVRTDPVCTPESLSIHEHTGACFDENGNPVCGYADFVVHTHDNACYDESGNLWCPLPEIKTHTHDAGCYAVVETSTEPVHTHTENCYISERGELTCTQEEIEGHVHSVENGCFDENGELICQVEENEGHQHTDDCYAWEEVLNCELSTEPMEADPAEPELVCGKMEIILHEHSSDCFDGNGNMICGRNQVLKHEHDQGCFQIVEETTEDLATPSANSTGETTRLFQYAEDNNGKVEITISDSQNNHLEPDPDTKEYDVVAGESYNVRVAYTGNLLAQGRYYVTFASNIDLSQKKDLILKDNQGKEITAGTWYFEEKENGVVWLIFDITADLSQHSDIVLIADVTCKFDYTDKPVEFDGNIKVNIKHNETSPETKVSKWAKDWDPDHPNKISWRAEIYGNSGSNIVGNIVTDTITTSDTHYYTEEDMAAGIEFEATKYKTESSFAPENRVESHYWTVKTGDDGLIWTESGWNYTMPEKITCTKCGEEITLGNDDWLYYMKYTSTVKPDLGDGYISYQNKVSVDNKDATGKIFTGAMESDAHVVKTGEYHHDPQGGTDSSKPLYANDTIEWTMTMTIPGAREGQKYDYLWHLWDEMSVNEGNNSIKWDNPLQSVTVTAVIGEKTYTVPNYEDVKNSGSDSPICWRNTYSQPYPSKEDPRIHPGQEISFYSKCICTENTCANWTNGGCGSKHGTFCECWCINKDATITFKYSTPAGDLTTEYGGRNAELVNSVDLNNLQPIPNSPGKFSSVKIDESQDEIFIPGVFTKQLTGAPGPENGYLAEYTITVNEAMADLASMQELTITDKMTKTLGFISATLKIQAEDAQGYKWYLIEGDDYKISYNTGGSDANILTIVLDKKVLGPFKYTLIYDASVSGSTTGLSYKNDASVELFGKSYDIKGGAVDVPSAVISAQTYGATLYKYDKTTQKPLGGAVFGLYAVGRAEGSEDVLMYKYTTENNGIVQVNTRPEAGVVLHTHILYYVQELEAPKGYQLDSTKHYFWFCDNSDEISCSKSAEYGMPPYSAKCVYSFKTSEDTKDLEISNEEAKGGHEMPSTGGSGTDAMQKSGMVLLLGAGLLLIKKVFRRKGEIMPH